MTNNTYQLQSHGSFISASFKAMASPCEILVDTADMGLADQIAGAVVSEVSRIEKKYSRYIQGNLCHTINNSQGSVVEIDDETYRLLAFAQDCYDLSDGMFDLTSGVLRRAWTFDCSDRIPTQKDIDSLLPLIGWSKVNYQPGSIRLLPGMEVDFGGIGKEYAVSKSADISTKLAPNVSVLINLGGDIQITRPRVDSKPWLVGIENHKDVIPIVHGALATSGDAKRYLLKGGHRYSHILNPRTGWPISGAPSSVTTHSTLCIQAGCLATLALLKGDKAESFLKAQNVQHWCTRQ